jgi:hypothetical protein
MVGATRPADLTVLARGMAILPLEVAVFGLFSPFLSKIGVFQRKVAHLQRKGVHPKPF